MLVSHAWLQQYVDLKMPLAELEQRLMMAGLNHEGTTTLGDDFIIDLEVTSNRPDCLGHIGVAREVAVLWDSPLRQPAAAPSESATPAAELIQLRIDSPQLCYRYTARVLRGVTVGPSPGWLARRLTSIGIMPINNIVDISNFVLFECSQPLHVFDLARLSGSQVIVRQANQGEQFEAINHKQYELDPSVCVIADAERPIALAGVMGGAETEVSEQTTDLLIESAGFDQLSVRGTARKLNLQSDSSYRFERGVDPLGIDWASRRCCELILEIAGGELAAGVVDAGDRPSRAEPITLRFAQLKRILGIDVPSDAAREILTSLGNTQQQCDEQQMTVVPPSWRRDLTREIDLIEEVARIHGYDKIPENVPVAMVPSTRRNLDRVMDKIRFTLTGSGFDEALTTSTVTEKASAAYSPWTDAEPLRCSTPVLRGADRLRRSLIASLLDVRKTNESLSNENIELFETAHIYLPNQDALPTEHRMVSLCSGRDFLTVKGVLETLLARLNPATVLQVEPLAGAPKIFDAERAVQISIDGRLLGYLAEVSPTGLKQFDLRGPATVAELKIERLEQVAVLTPNYTKPPTYPSIQRDLNLVVDESVLWSDLSSTATSAAGDLLERLDYIDTYRNAKDPQLGPGKKSLLMSILLRTPGGTLTGKAADEIRDRIVAACQKQHGAELRK